MIANLMQRYNPMLYKVQNIIKERILGELLYGRFENLASDEGLAPDHWFWDPKMSGGIFIEHGVHFFDLFEAWFGKGEVNSAQAGYRQPDGQLEHVNCAVKYAGEKFVNFYHGFHQSGRMDRQEFRLVFERGEIVLEEWVPTRMKLEALTEETQTRRLMDLFPKARLDILVNYGSNRETKGRFKEIDAYQKVRITDGLQTDKMVLYGELLRSMIADQKAWVEDKSHERKLTERNGLKSLQDAERASDLASVTRS
jgi:predicted dehydrogenase